MVEKELTALVGGDDLTLRDAVLPLVSSGGKRLRPALLLLWSRWLQAERPAVLQAAVAVELIHTATLVHDDLIDDSPTRRGVATVHARHGSAVAVIAGDNYLARGLELLASSGRVDLVALLASTVGVICSAELQQTRSERRWTETTIATYLRTIEGKTASLLATACRIGASLADLSDAEIDGATRYGRALGMAFQIADDVLDYRGDESSTGKPVGVDLLRGIVTSPLIYALADAAAGSALREILEPGLAPSVDRHATAMRLVRESNGPDRAVALARRFADAARAELEVVGGGRERDVLADLCDNVVSRRR